MIDSENTQEENINITLSVPIEQLRGIAPINYTKLSEMVLEQISISDLASDVKDNIDMDDLASDVKDNIDMDSLASDVKDYIDMRSLASDVKDYIDMDDFASDVSNHMKDDSTSFAEKLNDLMKDYNPINSCETGKKATKVAINAIRYDIMCHLYGQNGNELDVTITDVLRKFIKQEMLAKQEEEELSKYMANNEQDNKNFTLNEVYQILSKASDMNQNLLGSLIGDFNKFADNKATEQITIKAD